MIRFRPQTPTLQVALAGSLLLPCMATLAPAQDLRTTVQREAVRRQSSVGDARSNIRRGDAEMIRQDYEQAMTAYKAAVDHLNDAPATAQDRSQAINKFFDATMKLANQRIIEGRYLDAEAAAKVLLRPEYDPGYKPALTLLKHLEDPSYYNRTITPKSLEKVNQVKDLFTDAQGFYDTGRFDLAFKRYEQILAIDPTNIAARKGEERVDNQRYKYAEQAYGETRARAVWEVEDKWQRPIRRSGLDADPKRGMTHVLRDDQGTVAITRKLNAIVIPNIEFRQTTISDAVEFLRQESRRLDVTETNPENRGVNIFLKLPTAGAVSRPIAPVVDPTAIPGLPPDASAAPATALPVQSVATASTRITLTLSRIPLLEALRYVAQQAALKVKVEPYAVSIVPLSENTEQMVTAEFRVPPTFISNASSSNSRGSALNEGAVSATATGNRDNTGTGSGPAITRLDARTFLESSGVTFPTGASATYLASTSKLVVRNTQENIDLIESLVQQTDVVIRQVEIESKFVEITQNNLKELSFDWSLGQSTLGGSKRVFFGGGTAGASSGASTSGSSGSSLPFTNASGGSVGGGPLTAGDRSGGFAIQANALDALLFGGGAAAAAPGIFSVAGVFTDPQFQLLVRALNQQKGVDLLSAPRVTTKSGQRATIEIIREFLYPTQFQPPQIPQNIGSQNGGGGGILNPITGVLTGGSSPSFPVTPTTPTSFEKRNTGVTLEVEPVIGPDNFTIDLNLQPQVVDFDGFINYGSPIQTTSSNPLAPPVVLTPNVINQPIFTVRKVTTSVSVYDGSTVVLGGLVREDVQKVNDKVPILGDVPLVGRLFRSKVDQNIKSNLVIFVTARLIDPSGQAITANEEEEEVVQPLVGPDNLVVPTGPLPLFNKK